MSVQDDANLVLKFLEEFEQFPGDSKRGRYALSGREITERTGMPPDRLNDAVELLEESGLVEGRHYLGTAPYGFGDTELTARGRVEAERLSPPAAQPTTAGTTLAGLQLPTRPSIGLPVGPVGSPYGFKDEDWEAVAADRARQDKLIVVLGHQWKSAFFDTIQFRANVEAMFEAALIAVCSRPPNPPATLEFRVLQGGYGSHLFNEIARDIVGADLAVFDTSDLNANVMIELGVSLTWGIRTLVFREAGAPHPPSDVSGLTWAQYDNDGSTWRDPDHQRKLEQAVERSLRKKYRP